MTRSAWIAAGLGALLLGCGPSQKSQLLENLDHVARSSKSEEAKVFAPQQYLHATELSKQADAAYDAGNLRMSDLLAERATVTFEHAFVLARIAKAEARLAESEKKLAAGSTDLLAIEAQQLQVSSVVNALETRTRVLENALPLAKNVKSSPDRERARLEATRSLLTEARLLCVATQLIGTTNDAALRTELAKLAELDKQAGSREQPTPIDAAIGSRSACLTLLAEARRAHPEPNSATPTDALLEKLSRAGYQPHRNERGVVVTLRRPLQNNELSTETKAQLKQLAENTRSPSPLPVLVVVHSAKGDSTPGDEKTATAIRQALLDAGVAKVETALVGNRQPLVPDQRAGAAEVNARVELTFVASEW